MNRTTTLRTARRLLACCCIVALAACGSEASSLGPEGPGDPDAQPALLDGLRIHLAVSGGLAGADYSIELDGDASVLRGVRCERLCEFSEGQVLRALSQAEIDGISRALVRGGVLGYGERDFGVECCDQFHFDLRYAESRGVAHLAGSSEAFPAPIASGIGDLLRLIP